MAAQRRGSHLLTPDATMKFQISILVLRLPLESKTAAYLFWKDSPWPLLVSGLYNSTFNAPLQRGIYYYTTFQLDYSMAACARGPQQ